MLHALTVWGAEALTRRGRHDFTVNASADLVIARRSGWGMVGKLGRQWAPPQGSRRTGLTLRRVQTQALLNWLPPFQLLWHGRHCSASAHRQAGKSLLLEPTAAVPTSTSCMRPGDSPTNKRTLTLPSGPDPPPQPPSSPPLGTAQAHCAQGMAGWVRERICKRGSTGPPARRISRIPLNCGGTRGMVWPGSEPRLRNLSLSQEPKSDTTSSPHGHCPTGHGKCPEVSGAEVELNLLAPVGTHDFR